MLTNTDVTGHALKLHVKYFNLIYKLRDTLVLVVKK